MKKIFLVFIFLISQNVEAKCSTQTIIFGDKVLVCTTCQGVTTCV